MVNQSSEHCKHPQHGLSRVKIFILENCDFQISIISIYDPHLIRTLFKFNYCYLFPFKDLIKDSQIKIHVSA